MNESKSAPVPDARLRELRAELASDMLVVGATRHEIRRALTELLQRRERAAAPDPEREKRIEAWEREVMSGSFDANCTGGYTMRGGPSTQFSSHDVGTADELFGLNRREIDEALALMRSAPAAPPASTEVERLRGVVDKPATVTVFDPLSGAPVQAPSFVADLIEQQRQWLATSNTETDVATKKWQGLRNVIEDRIKGAAPNSGAGRLLADLVRAMAALDIPIDPRVVPGSGSANATPPEPAARAPGQATAHPAAELRGLRDAAQRVSDLFCPQHEDNDSHYCGVWRRPPQPCDCSARDDFIAADALRAALASESAPGGDVDAWFRTRRVAGACLDNEVDKVFSHGLTMFEIAVENRDAAPEGPILARARKELDAVRRTLIDVHRAQLDGPDDDAPHPAREPGAKAALLSAGSVRGSTTHARQPDSRVALCGEMNVNPSPDPWDRESGFACKRCLKRLGEGAPSDVEHISEPAPSDRGKAVELNLYHVQDGDYPMHVLARDYGEAVRLWEAHWRREMEQPADEPCDPPSGVALVAEAKDIVFDALPEFRDAERDAAARGEAKS